MTPFFVLISFVSSAYFTPSIYKSVVTYYGISEYRYALGNGDNTIGFLSSIKVPFLNWYVLCDLFVVQEHRSQGYGRGLLVAAISDAKQLGATKIFVQPGPFEWNYGTYLPLKGDEMSAKLKLLINFYQSCGFKPVRSGWGILSIPFLYCVYKIFGISESPSDLMVLHLN